MNKKILDYGDKKLKEEARKIAENLAGVFGGGENVSTDIIFQIIISRYFDDPPPTPKKLANIYKVGETAVVRKVLESFEGIVLSKDTAAANTLRMRISYRLLWQRHECNEQYKKRKREQKKK